jgi:ABC-type lipoprotein release transport system permease subunit
VVTQSTREIGIRIALGSTPGALVRRLLWRGGLWSLCGISAGLLTALAIGRVIASLLFEVSPVDVGTFAAAALTTFVIALVATYLPARRIVTMDPVEAIRQ